METRNQHDRPLHILIVEDSDADHRLLEVMLRRVRGEQDQLTRVVDTSAACRALGTHPDVDVALLDLTLPDSYGIDTVRRVATAARDVPIVVLTVTDDEDIGLACIGAGAHDYLPKSELRAPLLRRVIEYAVTRSRDVAARRRLEREVLQISENERQRIARDLHDDLGQQLTGVAMLARALSSKLAARGVPEAAEVEELGELVQGAISQSMALARGLDPLTEFGSDLPAALEALAQDGERRFRIRCGFRRRGDLPAVNGAIAAHLYRMAQEAITNAVKHGPAAVVDIELRGESGALELTVIDDGKATLDPDNFARGRGLRIMEYRARTIGAELAIDSNPTGSGLRIRCTLPAA
jgi:two-component system sensor kinase FixL